jgi:hypothetical protein
VGRASIAFTGVPGTKVHTLQQIVCAVLQLCWHEAVGAQALTVRLPQRNCMGGGILEPLKMFVFKICQENCIF